MEENWQLIEYLGLIAEDVPAIIFIDLEKGLLKYKAELEEVCFILQKNYNKYFQDILLLIYCTMTLCTPRNEKA